MSSSLPIAMGLGTQAIVLVAETSILHTLDHLTPMITEKSNDVDPPVRCLWSLFRNLDRIDLQIYKLRRLPRDHFGSGDVLFTSDRDGAWSSTNCPSTYT